MNKNDGNITSMLYQGDIDMSLLINGQLYNLIHHNNGSVYLKYLFAKLLVDGRIEDWEKPGFITIVKVEPESGIESPFIDKDIAISGEQLVDISNGYPTAATLTAYITYDDLREPVDATEIADFYIYLLTEPNPNNRNIKQQLAKFKVTATTLSYITPGTTATLNWTLKIINKGKD